MYKIREELSQDGEYTFTYLQFDNSKEVKIGNYEARIIAELQEKIVLLEAQNKRVLKDYDEATNKLHRRNLQIADLKKKLLKATEIVNDTTDAV